MAIFARLRKARRQHRGRLLISVLAAIVCTVPGAMAQQSRSKGGPSLSAEEILRRADAVRFPQEAFEVGVDIRTWVEVP